MIEELRKLVYEQFHEYGHFEKVWKIIEKHYQELKLEARKEAIEELKRILNSL